MARRASSSSLPWLLAGGLGVGAIFLLARRGVAASGSLRFLTMQNGAFDGQIGSVVVIPPGYNTSKPLDLAIYFHGFYACAENAVRDANGTCSPGGPTRKASRLQSQFNASGVNAILVLPETQRELRSGDVGRFRVPGAFDAFLQELLVLLAPQLGRRSTSNIRNISVMAHSGGYTAASVVLSRNDVAVRVRDVCLLDALYGDVSVFENWASVPTRSRFVNVYTSGTQANSLALRARLSNTYDLVGTPSEREIPRIGNVFVRSNLGHDEISRVWPAKLWATSPAFEPR